MTASDDELLDAITELVPKLLTTMEAFEQVQRNMHPGRVPKLAEFIAPYETELRPAFEQFQLLQFPDHLAAFGNQLSQGAEYCLRACNGFTSPEGDQWATMKAMRAHSRAQELIYPVAGVMTPVSQYFLEAAERSNKALLDAFNEDKGDRPVGIMHFDNAREKRGGFSLYVPEYTKPEDKRSLVVVLHGGTGHGADFIWSWVREARSRGFIVMSPTSQQDTWSLMGEEHDLGPLSAMLDHVRDNWGIDDSHIMLTGMSDGATYSLLAGLREDSPFTHLAPFSGVLHPEISMTGNIQHANNRNIYLVHGTLDWMFPIDVAYMAKSELEAAGANLNFHAVDGLSHTYARFQNDDLLNWFNPALTAELHGAFNRAPGSE
jgi:phospholipase/carboxylesterase